MSSRIVRNFTDFGNRKWIDRLPGGKGDEKTPADFDPDSVSMGAAVQGEHTNNPDIATEVALDHLTEDPEYYDKLIVSGIADEKKAKELYSEFRDDNDREKTIKDIMKNFDNEEEEEDDFDEDMDDEDMVDFEDDDFEEEDVEEKSDFKNLKNFESFIKNK